MNETLKIKSVTGHLLDNQLSWPKGKKRPVPLVILCHGFLAHSQLLFFPALKRLLHYYGYAVFSYDFPGHGFSPGSKSEVTLPRNIKDLHNIINALEKDDRLNLSRLIVIGHSLGGITALMSGVTDRRIKRIVAIGAALNFEEAVRQLLANGKMFYRDGTIYFQFSKMFPAQRCDKTLWSYTNKFNFKDRAEKIKAAVLMIAGEKDDIIPLKLTQETYRRLSGVKKITVIKKCGHLFIAPSHQRQLFRAIIKWLKPRR